MFNWLTHKLFRAPTTALHGGVPLANVAVHQPNKARPAHESGKAARHQRREQLYSAIRQGMTRAGVLSASFKFKVLSLDQRGDKFLVMMDIHQHLGLQEEKLVESERLIQELAKNQFAMMVVAVYWRVDGAVAAGATVKPLSAPPQSMTTGRLKNPIDTHPNSTASGFEDTELADLPALPALSPTQYGELN